ncbi:MAG: SpoIIE family protein phosphatase [candidate division KSB1 bacterium]|nr:SpoIIE family protein phosphatase [candidate division KSB1 bacterium]MDZ7398981.1 SpoIIE family protein phosphatase [candidate division KSB1 bacterium]
MREIELLQKKIDELTSLIDVAAIISSTLDLEELMNLVMEKAQAVMNAEASSVMLLNEETGELECEIALGQVHEEVKNQIHLKLGQGIAGWVAQHGEAIIVPDVDRDSRFFSDVDNSTGFKTRSILAAPLKIKDRVIGVAEVINRRDAQPFTEDNLALFTTFCRQVALAIENARMHRYMLEQQRLQQQLESAHRIQQSFMPQSYPHAIGDKFLLYAKNIPAASVGGDLFDFIPIDEHHLGLVIGDVSGKGIPAALYMARLISDLRYYSLIVPQPVELLSKINTILVERSHQGMFVSLIFMLLNRQNGELMISNAGHLPPLWHRNCYQRCVTINGSTGVPLGILANAEFQQEQIRLQPGDHILLYTDGVTEARNARGKMFSSRRLEEILNHPWQTPKQLIETVISQVKRHCRSTQPHDDITLLAIKWQ